MEIEILKDIRDSSGEVIYRAGQKDVHVPTSVGEHYIFLKEARRPVFKSTAEWMAAKERERQAALPPDKKVQTDSWGIKQSTSNDPNAPRFIVVHTNALGTNYYNAPPAHAPSHVKEKFERMIAQDNADWTERQAFLKRQASEPSTATGYGAGDLARVVVIGANGGRS